MYTTTLSKRDWNDGEASVESRQNEEMRESAIPSMLWSRRDTGRAPWRARVQACRPECVHSDGSAGLVVEVTGAESQTPVTVVVTAPDPSTRSATCTTATDTCPVSFPDFTSASLTVRVSTGTRSTEVSVQPAYQLTRPNGPDCPPECRSARVPIAL